MNLKLLYTATTRGAVLIFLISLFLLYQYQRSVCRAMEDVCLPRDHIKSPGVPGLQWASILSSADLGLLFKSTWDIKDPSSHCQDPGALFSAFQPNRLPEDSAPETQREPHGWVRMGRQMATPSCALTVDSGLKAIFASGKYQKLL